MQKRKAEESVSEESDVTCLAATCFEDGRELVLSRGVRAASRSWKSKETDGPPELPERNEILPLPYL